MRCTGLVKNVSEYAATVGETVKSKVQDTVSPSSSRPPPIVSPPSSLEADVTDDTVPAGAG